MKARSYRVQIVAWMVLAATVLFLLADLRRPQPPSSADRQEVVFWHFWGGKYRAVVEQIVERFNQSQDDYFVRAVAMPGNNLDMKVFMSVAGGQPPDVINQDRPIVADWAYRGAIAPLDTFATDAEIARLNDWLFPAARAIGSAENRLYALCNGLDIRALYYNETMLNQFDLEPPRTLEELDGIARRIAPAGQPGRRETFGYVPDPRRLWAWGIVFGGSFYDAEKHQVTADNPHVVAALAWMKSYSDRYGADQIAAFRQGDQRLAGSSFPLFGPYDREAGERRYGRYAVVMDGQWRVAEIEQVTAAAQARGEPVHRFNVVPLPYPADRLQAAREQGRTLPPAGWVNGNFFIVPASARNKQGAWEFMKFWSGFGSPKNNREAARACVAGGWIPASQEVVNVPRFQTYLAEHPLFAKFVEMASSPNQVPIPSLPVASLYRREIETAGQAAMFRLQDPQTVLREVTARVQRRLDALRQNTIPTPAKGNHAQQ